MNAERISMSLAIIKTIQPFRGKAAAYRISILERRVYSPATKHLAVTFAFFRPTMLSDQRNELTRPVIFFFLSSSSSDHTNKALRLLGLTNRNYQASTNFQLRD